MPDQPTTILNDKAVESLNPGRALYHLNISEKWLLKVVSVRRRNNIAAYSTTDD